MKKTITTLALFSVACATTGFADSMLSGKYGTIAGRVQYLGMTRNYENRPVEEVYGHSIGLQLGYYSPEFHGFDAGFTYNFAGSIDASEGSDHGGDLISNGNFDILNEAYGRYRFSALDWTNSTFAVGRKVTQGEVFKKSDIRQKPRSLEGIVLESSDVPTSRIQAGHAFKMSNVYGRSDIWDFNNFGDVFKTGYDTDGITWGEWEYSGIPKSKVALFNAHAWDVSNLAGARMEYALFDTTTLLGYYRNEKSVGKSADQDVDAFGLSVRQKVGAVKFEGGVYSVHGDNLAFVQTTTGFNNHAIGSSLIIYNKQYNGGADTAYAKATTKVGKLSLYGLYLHTWHQRLAYDAQELNVIAKYPLLDSLLLQFKGGVGYRDHREGGPNTTATDLRVFMTYSF